VILGPYSFALDREATVFAKTITVTTDQNGQAIVTIRSDAGVPTQVSLIRGTDIVSGNRVDASFTILQATSGTPAYSVSPAKASITGYYVNTCGGGSVSYVVYGGTAPYTVFASSLSGINLEVGDTRGQTVIVPRSGGAFSVVASSSACAGTSTTLLTITDATGRVITASFDLIAGTVALPTPPTPDTLVVTPPDARIVCAVNSVVVFTISGGTSPFTVATDRPGDTSVSGGNVRLLNSLVAGTVINVAIADAKSKTVAAKISCLAPNAPPLLLAPPAATVASVAGFCPSLPPASTSVTAASLGTAPYTVSLSVPSTVASATISAAGAVTVTPLNPTSVPAGTTIGITAFDSTGRSGFATLACQ
jgi:hypothetical protein